MSGDRGMQIGMPLAHSGLVRLCTDDIDERSRLHVWREVYSRNLFNIDIEPIGDSPFRVDVAIRKLPGIHILLGTRSASRTGVTRPLLQTAADNLILAITLRGRSQACQSNREIMVEPGSAILLSTTQVGNHALEDNGMLLSVVVPKAAIEPFIGDVGPALMRPIAAETDTLRLLINYARSAIDLGEQASPELQSMVAVHMRDLVSMLIGGPRDAQQFLAERGLRAARLHAIKLEIVAQLDRLDLSARTVALALGISPRYVHRLLQEEALTFTDYVLGLRLDRCFAMLHDPRHCRQAIGAIALASGFNDISYFNRSFRSRFGKTPREARAID